MTVEMRRVAQGTASFDLTCLALEEETGAELSEFGAHRSSALFHRHGRTEPTISASLASLDVFRVAQRSEAATEEHDVLRRRFSESLLGITREELARREHLRRRWLPTAVLTWAGHAAVPGVPAAGKSAVLLRMLEYVLGHQPQSGQTPTESSQLETTELGSPLRHLALSRPHTTRPVRNLDSSSAPFEGLGADLSAFFEWARSELFDEVDPAAWVVARRVLDLPVRALLVSSLDTDPATFEAVRAPAEEAGTMVRTESGGSAVDQRVVLEESARALLNAETNAVLDTVLDVLRQQAELECVPATSVRISGFYDPEEDTHQLVVSQHVGVPPDDALRYWDHLSPVVRDRLGKLPEHLRTAARVIAVEVDWDEEDDAV